MRAARRSRGRRSRVLVALAVVLALAVVGLGVRLVQVHGQTRDWRLSAAAAPSLLHFGGHDFLRGPAADQQQLSVLGPLTADGRTAGGGQIFVPTVAAGNRLPAPTLMVSTGGLRYLYSMTGGP